MISSTKCSLNSVRSQRNDGEKPALVISVIPDLADDSVAAVRTRYRKEREKPVRVALTLTLGLLGRYRDCDDDRTTLEACVQSRDPHLRAAGAIALAWLDGKRAAPDVKQSLVGAAKSPGARCPGPCWNDGRLGALAADLLATLGTAGTKNALDPLLAALARATGLKHRDAAERLLRAEFRPPRRRGQLRSPSELTAKQRHVLQALAASKELQWDTTEHLRWLGLPTDLEGLRRFATAEDS